MWLSGIIRMGSGKSYPKPLSWHSSGHPMRERGRDGRHASYNLAILWKVPRATGLHGSPTSQTACTAWHIAFLLHLVTVPTPSYPFLLRIVCHSSVACPTHTPARPSCGDQCHEEAQSPCSLRVPFHCWCLALLCWPPEMVPVSEFGVLTFGSIGFIWIRA